MALLRAPKGDPKDLPLNRIKFSLLIPKVPECILGGLRAPLRCSTTT